MHNELRYQAKIHIIFEKLLKEKKKICIFSSNYFILLKNNRKTTKTCNGENR
jgi:hypothetical protein